MMVPLHSNESQQQTGWFPFWRALLALCWRLSILLLFFIGVFACALLDHWWAALAFLIGFIVAAFIIRRVSTVEPESETSSGDSITFL
jgi:hypothetical protein